MNKTTEALKLAEEALHMISTHKEEDMQCDNGYGAAYVANKALAAIREALAEPVKQEPVDGLARACNLAGLDYEDFLRIKAYLPVAAPVDAKAIRAEERKECISNCLIVEHAYKNAAMWNHAQGAEACAGYLEDTK